MEQKVIQFKRPNPKSNGMLKDVQSVEDVLKQAIEKNTEVKRKLAQKRLKDNLSVLESYQLKG